MLLYRCEDVTTIAETWAYMYFGFCDHAPSLISDVQLGLQCQLLQNSINELEIFENMGVTMHWNFVAVSYLQTED
jgi:hypothetical protein